MAEKYRVISGSFSFNAVISETDTPPSGGTEDGQVDPPSDPPAPGSGNVRISVAGVGTLLVIEGAQVGAAFIFLEDDLEEDVIVEFPNINRTWWIYDQTERNGYTINLRRIGGDPQVLEPGQMRPFVSFGG